jgi:flagellar hook-associated protein 2
MSDNSTIFAGTSRYANDFGAVINRSLSIAGLPLVQMKSVRAGLQDDSSAMESLQQKLSSLERAVEGLNDATGMKSYWTSATSGSAVKQTIGPGVLPGLYSVKVTNLGAYSSGRSDGAQKVENPAAEQISTKTAFTLMLGDGSDPFEFSAANLNEMATAINNSGRGVTATIVNVGSGSLDYRLSLQSKELTDISLSLTETETGTELLNIGAAIHGENAAYELNGVATPVYSTSRNITIAPGLTAELVSQHSGEDRTDITVRRNADSVKNALTAFLNAYNGVVDEVNLHRGSNGGALAGNSMIGAISQSLAEIVGYSGDSGARARFADLGLESDDQGKLSLNGDTFDTAAVDFSTIEDFLGGPAAGGFLQAATSILDSFLHDETGALNLEIRSLKDQISAQDERMSTEQERLDQLEQHLNERLSSADALIAMLEQQVVYITGMFESMRVAARTW